LRSCSDSERIDLTRALCKSDLFFLLWYALGRTDMERPWLLDRCKEVQAAPNDRLDLWSREHYKSTIITFGLTIQDILNDPETTIGIFSHTRPIAKGFLRQIKREFEANELLKSLFPDVLWTSPSKEAPKWSEDDGIVVKRKSNPKESTIEAWGLVDGQLTSKHYRTLLYDDVVTLESVTSPGSGSVRVVGWATDADVAAPIRVSVTVDGADRGTYLADRTRGDQWNGRGFDVTLTGIAPGARSVCVTALNADRGRDVVLGCSTTGVAAVQAGQVTALEATGDGVRVATTEVTRTDDSTASVRVLVDGQFRASLRAGPGGIDESLPLTPGEHEVVVTTTSDGPRTIPIVLASAAISVPDPAASDASPASGKATG